MATILSTLNCDDENFDEWSSTSTTGTPPNQGVIEQVAAAARGGARGIHAASNGGTAFAQLDVWGTPMANLGDLRGVGFWARENGAHAAASNPIMMKLTIDGATAVDVFIATGAGEVMAKVYHDGGNNLSSAVNCFDSLDKWYQLQVLLIRHASAGGVQIYRNGVATPILDATSYDTTHKYDGVLTLMRVGIVAFGNAVSDLWLDNFRIGTTLAHCKPPGGGGSGMMGLIGH